MTMTVMAIAASIVAAETASVRLIQEFFKATRTASRGKFQRKRNARRGRPAMSSLSGT